MNSPSSGVFREIQNSRVKNERKDKTIKLISHHRKRAARGEIFLLNKGKI